MAGNIIFGTIKKHAKLFFCVLIFHSGFLSLYLSIYKRVKKKHPVVILLYHRFKAENEDSVLPKLYIKSFEQQMFYIKKWYHVITLNELIENIKNKGKFRSPSIAITIDDGFKDNYDLAYPILKYFNLPATIFLTSGLINTQKGPWVDEIGTALSNTKIMDLYVGEILGEPGVSISNNEQKAKTLHRIYEKLVSLDHKKRADLVASLLSTLKETAYLRTRARIMLNWEEIEKMSQNNISFGAHTLTHPTLSRMGFEDAVYEIRESKRVIENQLGIRVKHFAVPNGKNEDFTEDLRKFCRNGEFESVSMTIFGNVTNETDPYNLPRVSPDARLCVFAVELARLFTTAK
jgi:peptidoglycan/xylan/chitin deacetylase (PgdA/CDA1 family)